MKPFIQDLYLKKCHGEILQKSGNFTKHNRAFLALACTCLTSTLPIATNSLVFDDLINALKKHFYSVYL
jgi:hypothetical protein